MPADRISFTYAKSTAALIADIVANKGGTTAATSAVVIDRVALPLDVLRPLVAAHLAAKPLSGATYQGLEGPFVVTGEFDQAPKVHEIHELVRKGLFMWAGM